MSKFTNPTKVITGPQTRWSYANVWNPKSINGGTPKYSVSLIIPKTDVKTIEKTLENVLDRYGVFYNKSEVWIESERLYEVLYSFETEDSANGK